MSRLLIAAVMVFLAASGAYAEAVGSPPPKPPPLTLPSIVPLTGEAPTPSPPKPPPAKQPSQPGAPSQPAAPPPLTLPGAPSAPAAPPKAISVEVLVAQLKDADPQKRLAAAEGLAESKTRDPSVIGPLAAALKDADPQVRSFVVIALGNTQNPAALEPLIAATKDEQLSVRADAVRGLLALGGEPAATALAAVAKSGDESTRVEAIHALGHLKDARTTAAIIEALRDPQPSVAAEAATALGESGDMRALRPIFATMKTPDPNARRAAVRAVRWLGGAQESEEDRAVRRRIEKKRLGKFQVRDVELCEVLQHLRDTGGLNLHVRWKPLAARQIGPSTLVTASPAVAEPDGVLAEILLAVEPAGEVGWMIHRGVVIVSTLADLEACAAARTLCGEIPCAGGPKDLEVRRQLGLRLPKADCPEIALAALVQSLQAALKVDFRVNWEALKEFGVTQESKISVVLTDVPTEQVLRLVLHDLEGTGKVDFGVKDGAVVITSAAELAPLRRPAAPPLITPPAPVPVPSPQR